jgi:hypothetical protein
MKLRKWPDYKEGGYGLNKILFLLGNGDMVSDNRHGGNSGNTSILSSEIQQLKLSDLYGS